MNQKQEGKTITKAYKSDNFKKEKFVSAYKQDEVTGNISKACSVALISRDTYYRWLEEDEDFRKAIYDAKMTMCDEMEQVLISRAIEKSDTALIYWLKYNHPQYKEQPNTLVQVNYGKVLSDEREQYKL